MITQKQIAERYKISKTTVRRKLKENGIQPVKVIGQTTYYNEEVYLLFSDDQPQTETQKRGDAVQENTYDAVYESEAEQTRYVAETENREMARYVAVLEQQKEAFELALKELRDDKERLYNENKKLQEDQLINEKKITELETKQEFQEKTINDQEREIERLKSRSLFQRIFNK